MNLLGIRRGVLNCTIAPNPGGEWKTTKQRKGRDGRPLLQKFKLPKQIMPDVFKKFPVNFLYKKNKSVE